jgi:hypothetical protein
MSYQNPADRQEGLFLSKAGALPFIKIERENYKRKIGDTYIMFHI